MLIYFVIIPVLIAIFLYFFHSAKFVRVMAFAVQLGLVIAAAYLFLISREGPITVSIGHYAGYLGITLSVDNLAAVFILLTAFLFLMAAIYTFNEGHSRLFWFLFFIWQGGLMGVFVTEDFFNIFVLMEVVTIIVTVLIMYKAKTRNLYDGMIYLMINVIAIQFYLLGIGYVYRITGSLSMEGAKIAFAELDSSNLFLPYALMITFVALKCAIPPLHGWLPKAHGSLGAPSAVSALLSGLHIKAGVYFLIRFTDVFGDMGLGQLFMWLGIGMAFFGIIMALSQKDLKLILAYHTISQVGLIIAGLHMPGENNYIGGLYHIINHAVFKSALFLCSGIIIHTYGTRIVYNIRGLLRHMPFVAFTAAFAAMGIMGMPLFNASISKYLLAYGSDPFFNGILTIISLGTITSFVKYLSILFGKAAGQDGAPLPKPHVDPWKRIPVAILALLSLFGGIFGEGFIAVLFDAEIAISPQGYMQKALIFAASLAAAILLYKYVISRSTLLKKIGAMEMGFRSMCAAIGIFSGVLLVVIGFVMR